MNSLHMLGTERKRRELGWSKMTNCSCTQCVNFALVFQKEKGPRRHTISAVFVGKSQKVIGRKPQDKIKLFFTMWNCSILPIEQYQSLVKLNYCPNMDGDYVTVEDNGSE